MSALLLYWNINPLLQRDTLQTTYAHQHSPTQIDCNVLAVCLLLKFRRLQLFAKFHQSSSAIVRRLDTSHQATCAVTLQSKVVAQWLS